MRVTIVRDVVLGTTELKHVREAALGPLLRQCGTALGVAARASLVVRCTGDEELRRLNRTFAEVDTPTDVLAFAGDSRLHVGDVAISVARAASQAPNDPVGELRMLAVHGLLHCLGYDHGSKADAHRMTGQTRRLLGDDTIPELRPHTFHHGAH